MASAKKKLDEKNLKILRELVSRPENKHCFDCKQRGPTYINTTIGSFVCTTCSGMLRGLTPPHRVKSISMATFTPEEIEFISARGNEYCRKVWLGLCDTEQLNKDEQQIKEFMISKYERKRYYVKAAENDKIIHNGSGQQNPTPQPIPKIPLLNTSTGSMSNGGILKNNHNNNRINKNNNFFPTDQIPTAKETKIFTADPFSPIGFQQKFDSVNQTTTNFANFDNNPVFSPTSQAGWDTMSDLAGLDYNPWGTYNNYSSYYQSCITESSLDKCPPPPSEDRYAALKALDSLMKSQAVMETAATTQPQTNNEWGQTNLTWPSSSVFESNLEDNHEQSVNNFFNPFGNYDNGWKNSTQFVGNPFKTEVPWGAGMNNISNGVTESQSINFNSSSSIWNQKPNPFAVSTNGQSHHSSNPFL